MITYRVHFNVARGFGNVSKAAEMMAAECERNGLKDRVLTPNIAPYNTMVLELDFENIAEYGQVIDEYVGSDEWRNFYTKFNDVIEPGGTTEIWDVRATF